MSLNASVELEWRDHKSLFREALIVEPAHRNVAISVRVILGRSEDCPITHRDLRIVVEPIKFANVVIHDPVSSMTLADRVLPNPIARRGAALPEVRERQNEDLAGINHRRIGLELLWFDDDPVRHAEIFECFAGQPAFPAPF